MGSKDTEVPYFHVLYTLGLIQTWLNRFFLDSECLVTHPSNYLAGLGRRERGWGGSGGRRQWEIRGVELMNCLLRLLHVEMGAVACLRLASIWMWQIIHEQKAPKCDACCRGFRRVWTERATPRSPEGLCVARRRYLKALRGDVGRLTKQNWTLDAEWATRPSGKTGTGWKSSPACRPGIYTPPRRS